MGASNFQGTIGQYAYLHKWVTKMMGRPNYCEHCDKTEGKFEWANKSGDYLKEVTDWLRLCRSCHRKHDKSFHAILLPKTHCKNGHEFTPDNTTIADTGRGRTAKRCKTCRREYLRLQWQRRKLCLSA